MISISLKGRLGNQIFQYVICRLIALRNNYNFCIEETGEPSTEGVHIKNFFENLDLGQKDGDIKYIFNEDYNIQKYNPKLFELPDYTKISGFFQSPKYYENYEKIIKDWFTLTISDKAKYYLNKYNPKDFCYIHLRGTDYKTHNHWFLNKDYYEKGIQYIKTLKKDIKFLIITDDPKEANKLFPNIEILSEDMKTDFVLLLNSKYIIISNSSFSWWAAWLKGKEITIAPNNWLNYNKPELGFYPIDIKTPDFIYL
jgi:hypothetical protein